MKSYEKGIDRFSMKIVVKINKIGEESTLRDGLDSFASRDRECRTSNGISIGTSLILCSLGPNQLQTVRLVGWTSRHI